LPAVTRNVSVQTPTFVYQRRGYFKVVEFNRFLTSIVMPNCWFNRSFLDRLNPRYSREH